MDLPATTETRSGFEEGHTGAEQEVEQEQKVRLEREFEIQLTQQVQEILPQQAQLVRGGSLVWAIRDTLEMITQNIAH